MWRATFFFITKLNDRANFYTIENYFWTPVGVDKESSTVLEQNDLCPKDRDSENFLKRRWGTNS